MVQQEFEFVKDIQTSHNYDLNFPNAHRIDPEKLSASNELEKYLNQNRNSIGYKLYNKYLDIKHYIKNKFQKYRYGVNDQECYRLYVSIAEFVLPRLKHFKQMERYGSCPVDLTSEQWEIIIDESIWAFDFILNEEKYLPYPEIKWDWEKGISKNFLEREKTPDEIVIWNNYFSKMAELNERKQKALEQFVKYFEGFWN